MTVLLPLATATSLPYNGSDQVGTAWPQVNAHAVESLGPNYNELDKLIGTSGSTSRRDGHDQRPSGCDANGNMVTRRGQTIQYDPTNRPVKVTVGSTISRYTYDGDGKRTNRLDANGTIHYPGPHLDRNLGTATGSAPVVTKYYYATLGSQRRLIAFRRAGTLYYVGVDHLGGTARVMDSSFTAVDQMRYKPYGGSRDTGVSLQTDRLFTGQTLDVVAGRVSNTCGVQTGHTGPA